MSKEAWKGWKSIILEAINRFWTSKIKYFLKLGNKEKQSNSKTQFSNAIKNPSLGIEINFIYKVINLSLNL